VNLDHLGRLSEPAFWIHQLMVHPALPSSTTSGRRKDSIQCLSKPTLAKTNLQLQAVSKPIW
jgi:hypothetical protein